MELDAALNWVVKNWQNLAVLAVMLKTYVKINDFVKEQTRQKKILKCIVDICSDQHDDSAKKLMEVMQDGE